MGSRRWWWWLLPIAVACGCHHERVVAPPTSVRLLAINDLHGHLQPMSSPSAQAALRSPTPVSAGGMVALAATIEHLRAEQPANLLVAAGDLIGASPLMASLLRDEPVVQALDRLGLAVTAVGNHEFDRGVVELERIQRGGCPAEGCAPGEPAFAGAGFSYLAANVVRADSGERLFPGYAIRSVGGTRIAFIGAILRDAPKVIVAERIAGLAFIDEAASVNALVPEIRAQGVRAIVLLIHHGALFDGAVDPATCGGLQGALLDLFERLDPEIDLIVSGHTHVAYACRYHGRLLTQAGSFGQWVTAIDLDVDADGDVRAARAENHLVLASAVGTDPAYAELVERTRARAERVAQRPIARLGVAQITSTAERNGESALGRTVADAQLFAARAHGADLACMNAGGVRQPLPAHPGSGAVTYADVYATQPFGNDLVVLELSGAELATMLEQQWSRGDPRALLSCSAGFSYRFDVGRPRGQRVLPGSPTLHGVAIDPQRRYRLVVNAFLAAGGDGLSVLRGKPPLAQVGGDLDALIAWLRRNEPLAPPEAARAIGVLAGAH